MNEWLGLAVAVVMLLACSTFVAAEFAFVTVDRGSVERAAAEGDRRATGTVRALKRLSTQLSGAQLGITLTNLAIGFLAEPSLARLLRAPLTGLGVPEGAVSPTSIGIAFVTANVLTMVVGELVPKNLAIASPVRVSYLTQGFMRGFTAVMALPIRLFNGSANAIVRALGVEPQEELRSVRNPEEIASLVQRSAKEGLMDVETARLVVRSLSFAAKDADDIMTPRVRMDSLSEKAPVSEVLTLARQSGHSRFPVVGADADQVVGAVHVKHVVALPPQERDRVRVGAVMERPTLVPGSLELDPLLVQLREGGMQMAVVIDEFGGTAGVVTLEDVIEEIVGSINDEHDRLESRARRDKDGSWSLSGLLRPDEVALLTTIRLPEGDNYDTVAGLVLEQVGAMPEVGQQVDLVLPGQIDLDNDGAEPFGEQVVRLTVERLEGRRIDRIRLTVVEGPVDGLEEER